MATGPITIIGIDCATTDVNVGLALGVFAGGRTTLMAVTTGAPDAPVAEIVGAWLAAGPALLALDAPLGWPLALRGGLAQHQAGDSIAGAANALFRRETDRAIHARTGKLPLEVGADRIARTAHAALQLLGQLRARTGRAIPLAWDGWAGETAAIEVYPAATLRAAGLAHASHPSRRLATEDVWEFVARHAELPGDTPRQSRHAADAAVCVLAGADFVQGLAVAPTDLPLARAEGWIWTRA